MMAFDLTSSGWIGVSVLVALVSLFITVLLHMLAQAFSLQSLGMWAKSEYAQVAVSFLIIFFAAVMQSAGAEVVSQVTAEVAAASGNMMLTSSMSANMDPVEIAKAYINKITGCQITLYKIAYWLNFIMEPLSKISLEAMGFEGITGGALSGYVSFFHYVMNNLTYVILFNYVQYSVLLLSKYSMLYPVLPIGLVLRAFAPTRGVGGLMVAFALGFAFVFPFTYVLVVAITPNTTYTMCNEITLTAGDLPQKDEQPCYNSKAGTREQSFRLKSNMQKISGIVGFMQNAIGIIFLQAVIYPLVSLIMTFTFIRQTSSLFGADLAEIGRGLIKII